MGVCASNEVYTDTVFSRTYKTWFEKDHVNFFLRVSKGVARDRALSLVRESKNTKLSEHQYHVGLIYERGYGIKRNYPEALKFYLKAAKQDHLLSIERVALFYKNGVATEIDEQKAFKWYQRASEHGSRKGMKRMASFYLEGRVVEKDEVKAKYWVDKITVEGVQKSDRKLLWNQIRNSPSPSPTSPRDSVGEEDEFSSPSSFSDEDSGEIVNVASVEEDLFDGNENKTTNKKEENSVDTIKNVELKRVNSYDDTMMKSHIKRRINAGRGRTRSSSLVSIQRDRKKEQEKDQMINQLRYEKRKLESLLREEREAHIRTQKRLRMIKHNFQNNYSEPTKQLRKRKNSHKKELDFEDLDAFVKKDRNKRRKSLDNKSQENDENQNKTLRRLSGSGSLFTDFNDDGSLSNNLVRRRKRRTTLF